MVKAAAVGDMLQRGEKFGRMRRTQSLKFVFFITSLLYKRKEKKAVLAQWKPFSAAAAEEPQREKKASEKTKTKLFLPF